LERNWSTQSASILLENMLRLEGSSLLCFITHSNRRKNLYIVDLDESSETGTKTIPQGAWEISVVEWNPHSSRGSYLAWTVNWNLEKTDSIRPMPTQLSGIWKIPLILN
jgi:hypothetical protein